MSAEFDHMGRARLDRARSHATERGLLDHIVSTGGADLPFIVARTRAGAWTAILVRKDSNYIDKRATMMMDDAGYLVLG